LKPSSVYNKTSGAFQFAYELPLHIRDATAPDFTKFWAERPSRKPDPRYPTICPETHQILQVHARNWIAFAVSEAHADVVAVIDQMDFDEPDVVKRCVPWEKIHTIQVRLEGEDLYCLVMLTATGIMVKEACEHLVENADYEDEICFHKLPPTPSHPKGREVPMHHGDEVVAARQRMLRTDAPKQKWFATEFNNPDACIDRPRLASKIRTWGKWVGIPDLTAEDLRMTYICYLLARGDVGENFICHIMGTRDLKQVMAWKRQVDEAKARGHDFGQPVKGLTLTPVGHNPCNACGKKDNPVSADASRCSRCGAILPGRIPSKTTAIVAELANALARLREITGDSLDDRARQALGHLAGQPPKDEEGP
jgi:hypothetical protein